MSAAFEREALRARFPTLATKTYLNSGSYGLLATDVEQAFHAYLADRRECGADWPAWLEREAKLRHALARLLHADHDEIAITASASAGIGSIASGLELAGAEVVVSDLDFPTSGQIWHAHEARGATVVHVPEDASGRIPLEHFDRAIGARTKLVAISHVCYRNGARVDVPGVVRLAHARGALVLLDCYQSVGALDLDVRALGVDFAVGGMLKYLLGTAGNGFVYARRDAIARVSPTATGWLAQEDVEAMDLHVHRPAHDARRFQAGTPPVPNCYAAAAGLDVVLGYGIWAIEARVRELTTLCIERLDAAGCRVVTPRAWESRGPLVATKMRDAPGMVARLAARGIVASSRDGNLRTSFHFYNDAADVAALVDALQANRDLL